MSFISKVTALLSFGKKEEAREYFFALNIGSEKLTAALWSIEGSELKILDIAADSYSGNSEILRVTDKLLDEVLGAREVEPHKILFGVPDHFLQDEDLKGEYLKLLRMVVKELGVEPMAYVATSHALVHFLEKQEGVPTTAILVGFEPHHLEVTVARAGKLDGSKVIERGESSGADIEKALLTFTDVETLPSKILIYCQEGEELEKLKTHLLSFTWMSKLSFLHFPKIETLGKETAIKSVCLAGASEISGDVTFRPATDEKSTNKMVTKLGEEVIEEKPIETKGVELGFVVGDVAKGQVDEEKPESQLSVAPKQKLPIEMEDFEPEKDEKHDDLKKRFFKNKLLLFGLLGLVLFTAFAYLFLPKAEVKIFVEPKILERDTQVTADPSVKSVDEEGKIIPGQVVETEVSGSTKEGASGKKTVGDPAKGVVVIRNKTDEEKTLSKGTSLTVSNGFKFSLDVSVTVASRSAEDGTWGKATATVTATDVGADGNLPSGSDLVISSLPTSQLIAKSEGNFSGGTSRQVTVVSDTDQKRLLASLASQLRQQAKQQLQEKLPGKKILEEALSEEIVKKSFSKNINDQASEFSLNMTARYKGTAFEEKDLKQIVGKLVTTQAPQGYQLDLAGTETQADISKLEKDGKLIFLARFKAKLMPTIDENKVKSQIKGKSVAEVSDILKGYENVLGSEIKMIPSFPSALQRMPFLERNIKIEVGPK